MVRLKTYTPEERAQRRRRTSVFQGARRLSNDLNESWIKDLKQSGVDVDEFLKEVLEPNDDDSVDEAEVSSRVLRRISTLPTNKQDEVTKRMSSLSISAGGRSKRYSSFIGQSYEYDPVTGAPIIIPAEVLEQRKWEKEIEEDSRHFDSKKMSSGDREKNKQWAIRMARKHVSEAGFEPEVKDDEDIAGGNPSENIISTYTPEPTPLKPLPPVEELNLGLTSDEPFGPRNIGISPPSLPHKLTDVIPKLSRFDVFGIPDGIVVDGTLKEAWGTCDSKTMIIPCINEEPERCDAYIRCPRAASLVRCPECNHVSPATPSPLPSDDNTSINGNS